MEYWKSVEERGSRNQLYRSWYRWLLGLHRHDHTILLFSSCLLLIDSILQIPECARMHTRPNLPPKMHSLYNILYRYIYIHTGSARARARAHTHTHESMRAHSRACTVKRRKQRQFFYSRSGLPLTLDAGIASASLSHSCRLLDCDGSAA